MVTLYTDHDGTASYGDIGQDYLCGLFGMDRAGFIGAVDEMRARASSEPPYRAALESATGCGYDLGLELAIMLVQHRVKKKDVEDIGRQASNSIRDGFLEYLESSPDEVHIISAGPADWLRPFWKKYSDKIQVCGTELYIGDRGEYRGIVLPCGRAGKPGIIVPSRNLVCVGDSDGDGGMFEYVQKNSGLALGVGDGVTGDLNVPGYASWAPVRAAIEMYAELLGERQADLPGFDPAEITPNTDLGGQITDQLRKRDAIKSPLTKSSV